VISMESVSLLSGVTLQVLPFHERVLPTMVFAAIVALALIGYGVMKRNKGGLAAGIVLLTGVVYAYVRFFTPYLPRPYTAPMGRALFRIGNFSFTLGTLGAIIFLIVVIVILAWYKKTLKRSH
jgi:hypothetical protein